LCLAALGALAGLSGPPFPIAAPAFAAPAPAKMAGTWDLAWKNRRGERRTGTMTVEQNGNDLTAQVYDRGGATATGSLSGSNFSLYGRQLGLPFTVTGRVQGKKMVGTFTALGTERHFVGRRRGR
jgi:hypothetical protein